MKSKKYFRLVELMKKYKQGHQVASELLGIHRTTFSRKLTGDIVITTDEALLLLVWLNTLAEKNGDASIKFEDVF